MNNARRSFANVCLTESDTMPQFLSAFLTETKGKTQFSLFILQFLIASPYNANY